MEHRTRDLLATALTWAREGRAVALATVVKTWGSAPRRPGAHMVIAEGGDFRGSVSGGCVEAAVIEEAHRVLRAGSPTTVEYGVANEEAWTVGLACGGTVRIRIEPVLGLEAVLEGVLAARDEGRAVVVATELAGPRRALLDPARDGDHAVLAGDPGPWPLEEAREALRSDRATTATDDIPPGVFLRPHNPPVRVVVVGAVHIAQPLAAMVALLGFTPIVVDPRTTFAARKRFPGAEVVTTWPGEAFEELALDARTAVVALSHDPKLDDPALISALSSPAFYVGALGSRRTHAGRIERLAEAGVPTDALGRIHAPIGLDIGARSPAEIAAAIAGQIVAALRKGALGLPPAFELADPPHAG